MLLWEDSKRTASIYPAAFRKSKYISLFGWLYILGPSESKEAKNYHPFVQSCLLPPFWCFFMSTISSKRISYRELPYPTPTWKASWHGLCCLERKIWIQFSKHPCSVHHLNCQQNNQIYFQRSFYPEIIQTSSSTFGYIPSTEEQMKQRLQIPSTTLQPPPPKKKNNNNKSVEALPGKGTSHSQWKSFLVPSVSSSSTRFPLQAARKAVLSKGSGGLKFRINKRIRTSWFSWFNVSKLGWRKWWGNWKNDHRIGEGFYVYTLVSYTCSTGVLYQALSQHETSKGHLRLEMLMSETAW